MPVAKPRSWWCLCDFEIEDLAPETVCLEDQVKCEALVGEVAEGTARVLRGSLTHPCVEVVVDHPEDAYGGSWSEFTSSGWRSGASCRLPGPGLRSGRHAAAEAQLYDETLGGVAWASDGAEAIARFGKPERGKKTALPDVGEGVFAQPWRFPRHGLELRVIGGGDEETVLGMAVSGPSTLATSKGIRVGSSRAEVLAAYGDALDEDEVAGAGTAAEVRVGFDRIVSFTFVEDVVRKISIDGSWD